MASRTDVRSTRPAEPVYDLVNCGPRRRFVVRDKNGLPLIVHNCENLCQGLSRDVLAANMPAIEAAGYELILSVHDENLTEAPDEPTYSEADLSRHMTTVPDWADGLPLASAGFEAKRYRKG